MSNYYGKINVKLIKKEWLFQASSGASYLDVSIRENRNGPGKFGDTHMIIQNPSKEAKLADPSIRGPIIGNAKEMPPRDHVPASEPNQAGSNYVTKEPGIGNEDVPF